MLSDNEFYSVLFTYLRIVLHYVGYSLFFPYTFLNFFPVRLDSSLSLSRSSLCHHPFKILSLPLLPRPLTLSFKNASLTILLFSSENFSSLRFNEKIDIMTIILCK